MFNIVERFTAIFKILIGGIPAYLLGMILTSIFPNTNTWILGIINVLVILGAGFYVLSSNRKRYIDNGDEEYIPEWLEVGSYVALFLGTLISTSFFVKF
jgi:hypothetical protein